MTDLRKAAEMALAKLDHLWEIGIDADFALDGGIYKVEWSNTPIKEKNT